MRGPFWFPQRFRRALVGTIRKRLAQARQRIRVRLTVFCGIGNRTIQKINRGSMMLFRSSAAICGAVSALAISVTFARSEDAVHSGAVVDVTVHSIAAVDAASGDAIVGAASTYNPFRPGRLEGGRTPPPASAMIPRSGRLPSRRACARNLAGSNLARGRNMPSSKPQARRSSSRSMTSGR